jgi:hypothetical protein
MLLAASPAWVSPPEGTSKLLGDTGAGVSGCQRRPRIEPALPTRRSRLIWRSSAERLGRVDRGSHAPLAPPDPHLAPPRYRCHRSAWAQEPPTSAASTGESGRRVRRGAALSRTAGSEGCAAPALQGVALPLKSSTAALLPVRYACAAASRFWSSGERTPSSCCT